MVVSQFEPLYSRKMIHIVIIISLHHLLSRFNSVRSQDLKWYQIRHKKDYRNTQIHGICILYAFKVQLTHDKIVDTPLWHGHIKCYTEIYHIHLVMSLYDEFNVHSSCMCVCVLECLCVWSDWVGRKSLSLLCISLKLQSPEKILCRVVC